MRADAELTPGSSIFAPGRFRDPGALGACPAYIGKFRVIERIGAGGMGTVYRAWQEQPPREVAVKLLHPSLVAAGCEWRFEREVALLGVVDEPAVARIYEAGCADSRDGRVPYYVMELIDGERFDEYARRHELDAVARVWLAARLAAAVAGIHRCGILHRDLKPNNVLVEADGTPRVLDFGIARIVAGASPSHAALPAQRTATGEMLGTLKYLPPEAANGGAVDGRADVYALGVMFTELLEGLKVGRQRDLAAIIEKARATDMSERYHGAGALAHDLQLWLRDLPVSARPARLRDRTRRALRQHGAVAATALATLGLLAIGAGVAVRNSRRARAARDAARFEFESTVVLATDLVRQLEAASHEPGFDPATIERLERRILEVVDSAPRLGAASGGGAELRARLGQLRERWGGAGANAAAGTVAPTREVDSDAR